MKRALIVAAIAALLSGPAAARQYAIYGVAGDSCGRWTADRADPDGWPAIVATQWLAGFLTGYNMVLAGMSVLSSPGYYDILAGEAGTDFSGALAWIDNYCHENATVSIAGAAHRLVDHLTAR
jgi:hypothetical protein